MTSVCRKCSHLMFEGEENHVCPTADYIAARNQLIHFAALSDDIYNHETGAFTGEATMDSDGTVVTSKEIAEGMKQGLLGIYADAQEPQREGVQVLLRDYLVPNGKYPYEQLSVDLEALHAAGKKVQLISVPNMLMGTNHFPTGNDPWIWSDLHGTNYKTAADLLAMENGQQIY